MSDYVAYRVKDGKARAFAGEGLRLLLLKERLIEICKNAERNLCENGLPVAGYEWGERVKQVESGVVTDEKFAQYLLCGADYHQAKDREFSEYLRNLAGTWRKTC